MKKFYKTSKNKFKTKSVLYASEIELLRLEKIPLVVTLKISAHTMFPLVVFAKFYLDLSNLMDLTIIDFMLTFSGL